MRAENFVETVKSTAVLGMNSLESEPRHFRPHSLLSFGLTARAVQSACAACSELRLQRRHNETWTSAAETPQFLHTFGFDILTQKKPLCLQKSFTGPHFSQAPPWV